MNYLQGDLLYSYCLNRFSLPESVSAIRLHGVSALIPLIPYYYWYVRKMTSGAKKISEDTLRFFYRRYIQVLLFSDILL